MSLHLIGKDDLDPDTPSPPTVWQHGDDLVIQGWRVVDPETLAEVGEVPSDVALVRIPERILPWFSSAMNMGAASVPSADGEPVVDELLALLADVTARIVAEEEAFVRRDVGRMLMAVQRLNTAIAYRYQRGGLDGIEPT
jgi:hypothetical protein